MLELAPIHVSTCAAVRCSFVVLEFAAIRSNAKTQKRFRPTFNMARALGVDRAYTHVARVGIVRFIHTCGSSWYRTENKLQRANQRSTW